MSSKPYRNKEIGKHIRDNLVCCITGSPNPVNHHIIGHGYSGIATKAPDYLQMALSHELHTELHDHGWKSFELKYGYTQKELTAMTMWKVHADGVIDLTKLDVPDWVIDELEKIANE